MPTNIHLFSMPKEERSKWDTAIASSKQSKITINTGQYLEFLLECATNGNSNAQKLIADIYIEGFKDYIPPNLTEAVKWYKASATQKNYSSLKELIKLNKEDKLPLSEFSYILTNCNDNTLEDPEILHVLGIIYKQGIGIPKNLELAIKYIKQATKLGSPEAAMDLVDIYLTGNEIIDPDSDKAIELLKEMVDCEYVPAIYKLAMLYEKGTGMNKPKLKKSFKLYKIAGKLNDTDSIKKVSEFYRKGIGTEKDKQKAKEWEKKLGSIKNEHEIEIVYEIEID